MDFMPSNTTPPVKLDTQQAPDAPAKDSAESPSRKAANATEASKGSYASGGGEDAITKWARERRERAADGAAGALDEQQQNKAPADDQGGGLNHTDPWDRGGHDPSDE